MHAEINGAEIRTPAEFHTAIARALPFPEGYGRNLDALWDVITAMLERPLTLVWKNSGVSKEAMPVEYQRIVQVLKDAEQRDKDDGYETPFELRLE